MHRLHPLARCQATDSLAQTMLDLHKSLQAAWTPTNKPPSTNKSPQPIQKIDKLVYELYNLTDEEIKIVEAEHG